MFTWWSLMEKLICDGALKSTTLNKNLSQFPQLLFYVLAYTHTLTLPFHYAITKILYIKIGFGQADWLINRSPTKILIKDDHLEPFAQVIDTTTPEDFK